MSLQSFPVEFQLVKCDFCGTIHHSTEEATRHGCSADPSQVFNVGDRVYVRFTIGAGIEAIGYKNAVGVVTKVCKPSDFASPPVTLQALFQGRQSSFCFSRHFMPHVWHYYVEPINPGVDGGELMADVFPEPDLEPANKV